MMLLKQKFHLNLPQLITGDRFDLKGLTTFWWDNFDRNIETASGAGSSHNKPGIMFQEESACTVNSNENVSISKSKSCSVRLEDVHPIQATAIHLHLLTKILFKFMSKCIAVIYSH